MKVKIYTIDADVAKEECLIDENLEGHSFVEVACEKSGKFSIWGVSGNGTELIEEGGVPYSPEDEAILSDVSLSVREEEW